MKLAAVLEAFLARALPGFGWASVASADDHVAPSSQRMPSGTFAIKLSSKPMTFACCKHSIKRRMKKCDWIAIAEMRFLTKQQQDQGEDRLFTENIDPIVPNNTRLVHLYVEPIDFERLGIEQIYRTHSLKTKERLIDGRLAMPSGEFLKSRQLCHHFHLG